MPPPLFLVVVVVLLLTRVVEPAVLSPIANSGALSTERLLGLSRLHRAT